MSKARNQTANSIQSPGEVRIAWDDAMMRSLRATGAYVTASREAVELFFGTSQLVAGNPEEVLFTVNERILLTPLNAKRLAAALSRVIRDGESGCGADGMPPGEPARGQLPACSKGVAADNVRALFHMIHGLDIEYGFEPSFKVYERTLLGNRFLLGFKKNQLPPRDVDQIPVACQAMGMPAPYIQAFRETLPAAKFVHFGFEETPSSAVCKAYIEFDVPFRGRPESARPFLLHRGYKWDAGDNTRRSLATYTCFPLLSAEAILSRIAGIFQCPEYAGAFDIAKSFVAVASERIAGNNILYVEVTEENNPRRSFDINVYRADLQLQDVYPLLAELSRYYAIADAEFRAVYEPAKSKVLGHISGGINREGRDFFTVYFGVEGRFSGSRCDAGFRRTHMGR